MGSEESPLWGNWVGGGMNLSPEWGGDILRSMGAPDMMGRQDPGMCWLLCSPAPETEVPKLQGLGINRGPRELLQ